MEPETDYPYSDTRAATMLRSALDRAHRDRRLSIRALGKQLGYKQATVLSHMASGRVAIPLERAPEIAQAVELPVTAFISACIAQRAPEVARLLESSMAAEPEGAMTLAMELKVIADRPLEELTDQQKFVLREVVRDPSPAPRWLGLAELPVMTLLRRLRPELAMDGLNRSDWEKIETALRSD